jgi:protein tyrosine phosphatase (PTP) superfamily phosphohydrolase (DUF442 family)
MPVRPMKLLAAMLLCLTIASCGRELPPGSPAWFAQQLDAMNIENQNVDFAHDVMTSGQLTSEQFARLPEFGFRAVICLRAADEDGTGWEEQMAADRAMSFTRLPIGSAAELTAENAAKLKELIHEPGMDVVYAADSAWAVRLVELATR